MKIIKVKYLKGEVPNGKDYTFYSKESVEVGDIVQINEKTKGVVTKTGITMSMILDSSCIKTIVGKVVEKEQEDEPRQD